MNIMKILEFFAETKKEISKISWIKKRDLLMSSISVFCIVGIFSIFFLCSDLLISKIITYLLGLAK
jgi:preprotein translocase subunit SecE